MKTDNKPLSSEKDLRELSDKISDLSLQERLTVASACMDKGNFDVAQAIVETVSSELSWFVKHGRKIISNGGLKTFNR